MKQNPLGTKNANLKLPVSSLPGLEQGTPWGFERITSRTSRPGRLPLQASNESVWIQMPAHQNRVPHACSPPVELPTRLDFAGFSAYSPPGLSEVPITLGFLPADCRPPCASGCGARGHLSPARSPRAVLMQRWHLPGLQEGRLSQEKLENSPEGHWRSSRGAGGACKAMG